MDKTVQAPLNPKNFASRFRDFVARRKSEGANYDRKRIVPATMIPGDLAKLKREANRGA